MDLLIGLGVVFGIPAMLAVSAIINGFVLVYLWAWFAVPFGLPVLSVAHAIGLSTLTGFLTAQYIDAEPAKKDQAERFGGMIAYSFVRPGFVFLLGWLVHQFM